MKLKVDPVTASVVVLVVGLLFYNLNREPEDEENLDIKSFWCLGICATIEGEHTSGHKDELATEEVAK